MAAGVLGSVVGTVETFFKLTFVARVVGADNLIAGKGNVLQRLDDAAQLYRDYLAIDLRAALGPTDWDRLLVLYGIRWGVAWHRPRGPRPLGGGPISYKPTSSSGPILGNARARSVSVLRTSSAR